MDAMCLTILLCSGNEIGPFKAVEESTMAQLCTEKNARSDIFAWYNLIGAAGSAAGQFSCGWIVQRLQSRDEWTPNAAYRVMFLIYAGLGLLKTILSLLLAEDCELVGVKPVVMAAAAVELSERPGDAKNDEDMEHLLAEDSDEGDSNNSKQSNKHDSLYSSGLQLPASQPRESQPSTDPADYRETVIARLTSLLPHLSPRSRQTVLHLSLLFFLDSFASGLVPFTWQAYYFTQRFSPSPSTLGIIGSTASIIAAISNLFAASLAKRIGLVQTMVFTHLPSAIFLALIPASPNLEIATIFMWLRSSTSTMDAAPRQAFLSMAVLSAERTAVMGIVNVVKTTAQSIGPSVTGGLAGSGRFWIAFVAAGMLKAGYDLGMLGLFVNFKAPEEDEV